MKEKELREIATCTICGNKIGHSRTPLFWRVRIERYMVRLDTIKRQDGLATMLGGNSALAAMMGTDEDMAERISSKEITVCHSCGMNEACIAELGLQEAEDDKLER